MPFLKAVVDFHNHHKKPALERDIQLAVIRENNTRISKAKDPEKSVAYCTDYYFVDIEYRFYKFGERGGKKIDYIAVKYHLDNRDSDIWSLAIVELKVGDEAMNKESGIAAHIRDVDEFLNTDGNLESLKQEAMDMYNRKLALGLLDAPPKPLKIENITNTKPEFILILSDHNPRNQELKKILEKYRNTEFDNFDLKIAASSGMGYGLYSDFIFSVGDFLDKYIK